MASGEEQSTAAFIATRATLLAAAAVVGSTIGFTTREVQSQPGDYSSAGYWTDALGRGVVDLVVATGEQSAMVGNKIFNIIGLGSPFADQSNELSSLHQPTPSVSPSAIPSLSQSEIPSPTPSISPSASPSPSQSEETGGIVAGYVGLYDYEGVTAKHVNEMEHCGNISKSKVLLTFDDKASPERIKQFDEELKKLGAGAIFFPNKDFVDQASIDMLRADGFYVGNHTGSHPDLTKMKTEEEIKGAIESGGIATLFRPPYGATYKKADGNIYVDGRVIKAVEETGRRVCGWTVDTRDWTGKKPNEILASLNKLQGGDVILMHFSPESNSLQTLPEIKTAIESQKLSLCAPAKAPTTANIPEVTCSDN